MLIFAYNSRNLQKHADTLLTRDAKQSLQSVVNELSQKVELASELMDQRVLCSLGAAWEIHDNQGKVSLSSNETTEWNAINQVTKQASRIRLPKMLVGEAWLGQISSFSTDVEVPVVDRIQQRTGDTATIFQRMNDKGDMLRVATNVKKLDGKRAIGTFIPHSSPVVQTVLKGETFVGRAFVVNRFYITAYAPLKDDSGQVIGILYVGTPDSVGTEPVLNQINRSEYGQTGRYFAMHTQGDKPGQMIAGSVFHDLDIDNVAPEIMGSLANKAAKLKTGSNIIDTLSVTDNSGVKHRQLVVMSYFPAWDWAYGVSIDQDEALDVATHISTSVSQTTLLSVIVTAISGIIAALVFLLTATRISKKLRMTTDHLSQISRESATAAQELSRSNNQFAEGASNQAAEVQQTSAALQEVSAQAEQNTAKADQAADIATDTRTSADESAEHMKAMSQAMDRIKSSSSEISAIIKTIDEIAFQTNLLALNAAVEAARAGEAGAGFAVVADEVRALAHRSAQAASETTARIEDATNSSMEGARMCELLDKSMSHIVNRIHDIDTIIADINNSSHHQQQAVQQINKSMESIDTITQSSAASSEQTAAAATELSSLAQNMRGDIHQLVLLTNGSSNAMEPEKLLFTQSNHNSDNNFKQAPLSIPRHSRNNDPETLTFR